jgi:acetylornithine deacetylase
VEYLLARLRLEDREFQGQASVTAYRPAYRLDPAHVLPVTLGAALRSAGHNAEPAGMTFWTDAAILAAAGIPSVLFGPGGAGLHSAVEYVNVADVIACRDVLMETVKTITSP